MAHLPRRLSALIAASALLLTAGACSSDDKDSADPESSDSPSASPTASESPESPSASATVKKRPSRSATPSAPSPSASKAPSGQPSPSNLPTPGKGTPSPALVGRLLSPAELPGLNDRTVWSEKSTGTEGSAPFGDCQKSSITDIGATDVVVRTFDAHGSQAGAQLIATFADPKSAMRAEAVLKSWRDDCKTRLHAQVRKVSPMTKVSASTGSAQSYLVQFGKRNADEHNFHGVGITRVGSKISLITVDVMGQDYNYEEGREPAALAAAAAADRL